MNVTSLQGSEIYVGGKFTAAGGVAATNVAKWNGTNWSALGNGVNGAVNALAIHKGVLYAGGTFTNAGAVNASLVAKWDGTNWSALGTGIQGASVNALAVSTGNVLYAGGDFDRAGGANATNIARWNGTNWSSLGTGVNAPDIAYVLALVFKGNDLLVGGTFTEAGGVSANNIARWNGANWSALGDGVDDTNYLPQVAALTLDGNELYVGGAFSCAGTNNAMNIARWDGTNWNSLGDGLERFFGELPVSALAVSSHVLIAAGRFVAAGDLEADNLAAWDGTNWMEFGGGVIGEARALGVSGSTLFVGGAYTVDAGLNNFAQWDGVTWTGLGGLPGQGIAGSALTALAVQGSDIFAGGIFTNAGNVAVNNIARWDGTQWWTLGAGVNGAVHALCASGNQLFAGGQFTSAGGVNATNIARWDGVTWHALSNGLTGSVSALACDGSGQLFAGGAFQSAGTLTVSNIARWDGSAWMAMGSGLNGSVRALAVAGNALFAGGKFTIAGDGPATNIARWNGTNWSGLGSGVSGVVNPIARVRPPPVSALALRGNDLYVGGDFATAGGLSTTNVAKWDGTNWSALGTGLVAIGSLAPPSSVSALAFYSGMLCAGGTFTNAGGPGARNLAVWDGSRWTQLGGGTGNGTTPSSVLALAVKDADLATGGSFQFAGNTPSANFAIWRTPVPVLQVSRSAGFLILFWPADVDPGFTLQSATHLAPPVAWAPATNAVTLLGTQKTVSITLSSDPRFYRLKRP